MNNCIYHQMFVVYCRVSCNILQPNKDVPSDKTRTNIWATATPISLGLSWPLILIIHRTWGLSHLFWLRCTVYITHVWMICLKHSKMTCWDPRFSPDYPSDLNEPPTSANQVTIVLPMSHPTSLKWHQGTSMLEIQRSFRISCRFSRGSQVDARC